MSSHHPQEVLLAQFSLYKGDLKSHSLDFQLFERRLLRDMCRFHRAFCTTRVGPGETWIGRAQNRGTFLWTVISEKNRGISRSKIVVFLNQQHVRSMPACSAQRSSLKSYEHFLDLGMGIALSHRHVGFFG